MRRTLTFTAILSWLAVAVACDERAPVHGPDGGAQAAPGDWTGGDVRAVDAAAADAPAMTEVDAGIDAAPPPEPLDTVCLGTPPAGGPASSPDGCATPPTGDWIGTASIMAHGAGSQDGVQADVRWTLTEQVGCVDHYRPSGTAREAFAIGCCCQLQVDPRTKSIQDLDGELIIDRSVTPPTYRMSGSTQWQGTVGCPNELGTGTLGGTWLDAWGAFDGAVIAGSAHDGSREYAWRFTRVDASFTPPADCTVPPRESWTSTFSHEGTTRTVTWIRAAARDCVFRYVDCSDPEAGNNLRIDRSVSPPTYSVRISTMNGIEVSGVLEGDEHAGGAPGPDGTVEWTMTRTWCGSPSCFAPPPAPGGAAMTSTTNGAVPDLEWQHLAPVPVVPGTRFVARLAFFDGAPHVVVRWNAQPDDTHFDCYARYGHESCDLDVPATATTAYVSVRGWNVYDQSPTTAYALTLDWTPPP